MKKIFSILIFFIALTACNKPDPKAQIQNISGYWEIIKVELSKDSVKNYGMSQYIDYIELKDSTGFRKKLQPKLDGTFIDTQNSEKIKASIEGDSLRLHYTTPFDEWTETVLKAEDSLLVIKNRNGKIYHYRTYTPILDHDEKK